MRVKRLLLKMYIWMKRRRCRNNYVPMFTLLFIIFLALFSVLWRKYFHQPPAATSEEVALAATPPTKQLTTIKLTNNKKWEKRSRPISIITSKIPQMSEIINKTTTTTKEQTTTIVDMKKRRHLILISAIFSAKSRVYSDNKFVLLINAPVDAAIEGISLVANSSNGTDHLQKSFNVNRVAPPNIVCKWSTYMAVVDSVENPKLLEFGHGANNNVVPVQFQWQYLKKRVKVATCISPLFLAENWQLVVLAIEIYRHYGIKLQVVYLMSAIEGIFEILKAYNSRDILQLEPWPSIEIEGLSRNDINLELDWRNQATAHTDCLIKYGYAAEFLIVGDIDDILVPDHSTYYEEFIQNDYRYKKNAVALLFNRFTVDINSARNPSKFSLFGALTSASVAFYQPDDPKYAVNTSRAESLWIHWPFNIKPNTASRLVPSTDGRMLHFRNWHFLDDDNGTKATDTYMHRNTVAKNADLWRSVALNKSFISTEAARRISRRFEKDIFKPHFGAFRKLPTKMVYSVLIEKCYDKIFYRNDKQVTDCPGPHRCSSIQPVNGLKCYNAKRIFVAKNLAPEIFLYASSSNMGEFEFSKTGCTL